MLDFLRVKCGIYIFTRFIFKPVIRCSALPIYSYISRIYHTNQLMGDGMTVLVTHD